MTGLLYFIVIAMWASVLIPIGLKNHDRRNLEKSVISGNQRFANWHWQERKKISARQLAFIRRRRVAMLLLANLIGITLFALSGKISFAWLTLPIALLSSFTFAASKYSSSKQQATGKVSAANAINQSKTVAQSTIVVERLQEETVSVQKRTWVPVETPLPNYVATEGAANFARMSKASRPWTDQAMVDAAIKLRQERAERLKEAQARLESARALAMEKARRAAIAASRNNGSPVTPFNRASNQ